MAEYIDQFMLSEHGAGTSVLDILARLNKELLPPPVTLTDTKVEVNTANDAGDTEFFGFCSEVVAALCRDHNYSKENAIKITVDSSEILTEIFDEGISAKTVASNLAADSTE